jgi:thiosulfate dehydrogenase
MEYNELTPIMIKTIERMVFLFSLSAFVIIAMVVALVLKPEYQMADRQTEMPSNGLSAPQIQPSKSEFIKAPDINLISDKKLKESVLYGQELIVHTSKYLGPKGSVKAISNGMNCQNCHLEAGTKPFGNNYFAVAANYPRFRARSGTVEDLPKRINDCFERSLNGKPLDKNSNEMRAIVDYISFLGKDVAKAEKPKGSGIHDLAYLDRAADPLKGQVLYTKKCQSCHRKDGQGNWSPELNEYAFPPLWGKSSFNQGAGLFRLSRMAGYIKYNMPQGATIDNPILTDEEAWDLAAYINSQPRPRMDLSKDWPEISKKPIDHPFGPFSDSFNENQHKFGPYKPILEAQKLLSSK